MSQPIPRALIVAHGQPSDPRPAAAEIEALAARVAALLPGWQVGAATLAEPGALARAVAAGPPGLVHPLFMAGGWFTQVNLPARLAAAGGHGWRITDPLGTDPALHDLTVAIVREALAGAAAGSILLAAHGSSRSPAPAEVAQRMARRLTAETGLPCDAAFIEQPPRIAEAARGRGDALCLPFFAARGGHVAQDLPAALAEAGFAGRVLPPVGLDPRVPGLIAAALARAA